MGRAPFRSSVRRASWRSVCAVAVTAALVSCGKDSDTSTGATTAGNGTTTSTTATNASAVTSSTTSTSSAVATTVAGLVLDPADFAGSGQGSASGEGGPATSAGLERPENVAVSSKGDVYIADNDSQRILKVSNGQLSLVYRGDSGKGESNTFGVAVGPDDKVWFSNGAGVFRVDGTTATKVIDARAETMSAPFGLAFDPAGDLYIAEVGGQRVRKYDRAGKLTIIAGTGAQSAQKGGVGDGGAATAADLGNPVAVAVDSKGRLFVAENFTRRIRVITPDGKIATFAGGGTTDIAAAASGTAGPDVQFSSLYGVAVDRADNVYVADGSARRIVRFTSAGKLGIAATTVGNTNGGLGFGPDGTLYFVDSLRVRRLAGVG